MRAGRIYTEPVADGRGLGHTDRDRDVHTNGDCDIHTDGDRQPDAARDIDSDRDGDRAPDGRVRRRGGEWRRVDPRREQSAVPFA
jgi:hypothetical protein